MDTHAVNDRYEYRKCQRNKGGHVDIECVDSDDYAYTVYYDPHDVGQTEPHLGSSDVDGNVP